MAGKGYCEEASQHLTILIKERDLVADSGAQDVLKMHVSHRLSLVSMLIDGPVATVANPIIGRGGQLTFERCIDTLTAIFQSRRAISHPLIGHCPRVVVKCPLKFFLGREKSRDR